MLHDSVIALIRTAVPAIVGTVLAWLIQLGIDISTETQAQLSAALIPIVISAYYAGVTYLERNVNPSFGWLLGAPKAPTYGGDIANYDDERAEGE